MPEQRKAYVIQYGEGPAMNITVEPVSVLREGVLPGCSLPTLTIRYLSGDEANCSLDMVFETEQDAWIDIKNQTIADIADMEQQVKELNKCIAAGYDFLQRIDLKLLEWL